MHPKFGNTQGDVIQLTKTIKHLTEATAIDFLTTTVLEQLQCTKVADLTCKIIQMAFKLNLLSKDNIDMLNDKITSIAKKVLITPENCTESMSLEKYVSKKYRQNENSYLCHATPDIINQIGSFMNHQDCIQLSQVNTHLCIMTNKAAFIKNKSQYGEMEFNHLHEQRYPSQYWFPNVITLQPIYLTQSLQTISKAMWLQKMFFSNINELYCNDCEWLLYLPLSFLFDKRSQYKPESKKNHVKHIKRMYVNLTVADTDINVRKFSHQWNTFASHAERGTFLLFSRKSQNSQIYCTVCRDMLFVRFCVTN